MIRSTLLAAALLSATGFFVWAEAQRAEAAGSWLGQKVLARKAGASLIDTGKDGTPMTLPVRHIVYTVVAEDGDRIRVNYPGQEG